MAKHKQKRDLIILPLKRFTYKDFILSAFESDLREQRFDGSYPWIQRLHNSEYGVAICSHHTGVVEHFVLQKTEKDREGDTTAWYFVPVNSKCKVKQVVIFND